ncbi:MAG: ATP-binding protein, partial [Bdellovibrio sp.]
YDEGNDDFGFLLMGKSGVGKTFILNAMMNKILKAAYIHEASLIDTVAYFPMGYLLYQFRTKKDPQEFQKCLKCRFLFLDDLGSENTTDFAREHFFTILDLRCQKRLPTFISTNLSLNELTQKYGERVTSRLKEMCAILEIKGSDKRTDIMRDRISILRNRTQS